MFIQLSDTNLLGERVPADNVFLQTNAENKYLGSMLWNFFDKLTLGFFQSTRASTSEKQKTEQTKEPKKEDKPIVKVEQ